MNPPKAPGTYFDLPPRKPDLEIVDVGARNELQELNRQLAIVQEKNEELEKENRELENKVNNLVIHLNNFEFSTLEHLTKPNQSSMPASTRIKKWTVIGSIIAAMIAAGGAVTSAVINSRSSTLSKAQLATQAEETRKLIAAAQKSTEETFMAGAREGARQTVLELEKSKPVPPIKKPNPPKKVAPKPPVVAQPL
jgi:cell division septum initiation protein DivIVA